MNVKIAFAVSLAVLLCTCGGLRAQDAPPSPPPMQEAPPETKPATPPRVRIGGNVQAAKMIYQVQPVYPQIAKTAHVQGTVILQVVVAKDGTVLDLKYLSGPALLMRSSMDAVRQWRYAPTLLNGEPVEVDTTVSVVFTLDDGSAGEAHELSPPPIDAQFRADVLEMLEVMNFRELFANIIKEASKSSRGELLKVMPQTPNREKIVDAFFDKLGAVVQTPDAIEGLVRIYAKYLTDEDVKAATKFYQTPSGKHVLDMLPKIEGEAASWGRDLGVKNALPILKQLCEDFPELKGQAAFCPGETEKSSTVRKAGIPEAIVAVQGTAAGERADVATAVEAGGE